MHTPVYTTAEPEPDRIEQELRRLWAKLAQTRDSEIPLIKKNAVSLLAVVADSKGAAAVTPAVAALSRHHPGRFITIVLQPDQTGSGEADGSRCALALACTDDTCYEHIVIPNRPENSSRLPQLAKMLLPYDLPVILWWRCPFQPEEPLFQECSAIAEQVILDSITMKSPHSGFARILELLPTRQVRDINWSRLTPWRAALAGLYDLEVYRPFLAAVDQLEISYSHQLSRHHLLNNSQVLLLFSWLASRLGWSLRSGLTEEQPAVGYRVDAVTNSGSPVRCHFRIFPAGSHLEAGIKQICLTAGSDRSAQFSITLCQDNRHLRTLITLPANSPPAKITSLETGSETDLISDAMRPGLRDHIYQQTLEYLGGNPMLWKFGAGRDTGS